MPVRASTRLYGRPRGRRLRLALAVASCIAGAGAAASEAQTPTSGSWQPHHFQFQYLGTNTAYGCVGLTEQLRTLLSTADVVRDLRVTPLCLGNQLPNRFAQAELRFQSLTPGAQGGTGHSQAGAPGTWRQVHWAPGTPRTLGAGDCSLMEQLLRTVLPMLATRNLQTHFDCQEHQDYGQFSVNFEVFVPAEASK